MVIEPCVQVNAVPKVARADLEWRRADFTKQGLTQPQVARGLLLVETTHSRERWAGLPEGFPLVHYAGLLFGAIARVRVRNR